MRSSLRSPLRTLALLAATPLLAQGAEPPPAAPLAQGGTAALVARYTTAGHWVQKVVTLLSLNTWWHPVGTPMVVAALKDDDPRLCAFGIETLLRADAELLPKIATAELLDELITRQLQRNNPLLRERALLAVQRLAPDAKLTDRAAAARWWSTARENFQPAPWTARELPPDQQQGTAVAQRASELYQNGLDLMLCIDSTGSMQPTIDALGAALGDMVGILDGLSPKFRLGVVHYKDYGELGKPGAKVVQPFTKNVQAARKALGDLRADGGGDLPEAVLGGLNVALDGKLGWKKDANKILVVIGDAPPHPQDAGKAVDLVRHAHDQPGVPYGKPLTGPKPTDTPFLTSCIGVVVELLGNLRNQPGYDEFVASQKQMREDFQALAKAGGGVFVEVKFTFSDEPPPRGKDKEKAKDKGSPEPEKGGGAVGAATRRIVEHILVLSFGERYAREMRDLVRIFYEYTEAGFLK